MDLAVLEMTKEEAAERLREYEKQIESERTVEDDAIRAGYRAAARGLPVVLLSECIARGGWFDNGLPRIAVCRADATECWVSINGWRSNESNVLTFRDTQHDSSRGALVGRHHVTVRVPAFDPPPGRREWSAHTIVPLIPPQYRPRRNRIKGFHILWEVEKWNRTAPRDPALLRHVRGDLWAVVATWDLTDLERAVLSARG